MWIQVRTIDGTQTQTIDDLSRLTKIECLREKIQETFRVSPDRQRLFYRGKQVRRELPYPGGPTGVSPNPGPALCAARGSPSPPMCRSMSSRFCLLPGLGGRDGSGEPALTECSGIPVFPDEVKPPESKTLLRVLARPLCVFVFPPERREAPPSAPAFILPK